MSILTVHIQLMSLFFLKINFTNYVEERISTKEIGQHMLHVASLCVTDFESLTRSKSEHSESSKSDDNEADGWWRRPVKLLGALNPFEAAAGWENWTNRTPRFYADHPFLFIIRSRAAKPEQMESQIPRTNSGTQKEDEQKNYKQNGHFETKSDSKRNCLKDDDAQFWSWLLVGRITNPTNLN